MVTAVYLFKWLLQNCSKKWFKKDSNKFLYNSVVGKSIQSEKKWKNVRAVTNKKKRNKQTSLIYFKDINFLSQYLQLIKKRKRRRVNLDKPIFIGHSRLDESKILLYWSKYECMITKWGKKVHQFYMYTGSY